MLDVDTVTVALRDTAGVRDEVVRVQCDTANVAPAIRIWTGPDARDALDAGVDLLVTDDAAALEYAASLPSLTTLPLAWWRTYVLVTGVPLSIDDTLRAELARHAVHVEARAAETPPWWSDSGPAPSTPAPPPTRLAYQRGDPVARDIAERLVALGVLGRDIAARAADDSVILREAAYVTAVCREPRGGCAGPPAAAAVIPLIETRARVVAPRSRVITPGSP